MDASDILELIWNKKQLDTIVICPECKSEIKISDFIECEFEVEECSCGTHQGFLCPECNEPFDAILGEEEFLKLTLS